MWKGTEDLQIMREEFESENQGILTPTQVEVLANHRSSRQKWQIGEIATSSVVFVVKGSIVEQRLVNKCIKATQGWYQVHMYTDTGSDSSGALSCGWGHVENKCSSKLHGGNCSGHHWSSDYKCNVVGCNV